MGFASACCRSASACCRAKSDSSAAARPKFCKPFNLYDELLVLLFKWLWLLPVPVKVVVGREAVSLVCKVVERHNAVLPPCPAPPDIKPPLPALLVEGRPEENLYTAVSGVLAFAAAVAPAGIAALVLDDPVVGV